MQLDAPLVCTVPWSVVCGLWCDCGLSVGPGMVGTLRVDDGSDKPFHVEAPGGAKWWYSADVSSSVNEGMVWDLVPAVRLWGVVWLCPCVSGTSASLGMAHTLLPQNHARCTTLQGYA